MGKQETVSRVVEALGIKQRMVVDLAKLEENLRAANVSFEQDQFRKHADDFVGKAISLFEEEYSNRFSEEELAGVAEFCEGPGRRFLDETFKIQRELAAKLLLGGRAL